MNLKKDGVEIISSLLGQEQIGAIVDEIEFSIDTLSQHSFRNAEKKVTAIAKLASHEVFKEKSHSLFEEESRLVRALFFDKTKEKNWSVSWHQDKTVSVSRKVEMEGWGPWSIKDSIHHVQPPDCVLNRMLTFRIHLDDCDETNGCLKVIPRSYKEGILKQSEVKRFVLAHEPVSCVVNAGDAVVMRPHIVHSSNKSQVPGHRRVIHLEYSNFSLPKGLKWA